MKYFTCHLLLAVLAGMLVMPPGVGGVTTDYNVTFSVGEEYNDNVNESASRKGDMVTAVAANGQAKLDAGRVQASGTVDGSYNFYALGNRGNEFKGSAGAKVAVTLVQDLLFLEGEDQFRQVYRSLTRGETNSTDSTRDMVNQNTVSGRLYITPRLGERTTFKLGGEFNAVIYDSSGDSNRQTYSLFAQSGYDLTPTLQLLLDLQAQHIDNGSYWTQTYTASTGASWVYSPNGSLTFRAGPRFTRYSNGASSVKPYGNASLTHNFGRASLGASLSSEYTENPSTRYPTLKSTAGVTAGYAFERWSVQARASYSFMSGEDTENTQLVSLGLSANYDLTSRLRARAGFSRESSADSSQTQARWYVDGSLSYDLGRDFSLEGYYKWKLSDTMQGTGSSYQVNIVGLRIRKTF